jgi:hypothetical protein
MCLVKLCTLVLVYSAGRQPARRSLLIIHGNIVGPLNAHPLQNCFGFCCIAHDLKNEFLHYGIIPFTAFKNAHAPNGFLESGIQFSIIEEGKNFGFGKKDSFLD